MPSNPATPASAAWNAERGTPFEQFLPKDPKRGLKKATPKLRAQRKETPRARLKVMEKSPTSQTRQELSSRELAVEIDRLDGTEA